MESDIDADEYRRDAINEYLSNLHQMSEGRLFPARMSVESVEWHIFQNYQSLMTEWERRTLLYLSLRSYADACTNKREYVKGHNKAKKLLCPEIEELLQRGEEAFLAAVRDRILQEHGDGILNLCRRCGALARTAHSKQCHKCFFSWHNEESSIKGTPIRGTVL